MLAVMLRRHRADDTVTKAIGRLIRADLIGIGDIGMLPVAPDAAEALFRVVDAAYAKRSLDDRQAEPVLRDAIAARHARYLGARSEIRSSGSSSTTPRSAGSATGSETGHEAVYEIG